MTETLPASRRTGKRPDLPSFPWVSPFALVRLLVGRNRPTGGIHAHGAKRQRVLTRCTWRQRRGAGREGIVAAAQALFQAAVVPGRRGRCRGRPAGRRRDDAVYPVPRLTSPPVGPRLRRGDLCRQPAGRSPRHGRAEHGRPEQRPRAAARAARSRASAGTSGPPAGPPRRAEDDTVGRAQSGTVAEFGLMDPPPSSPPPPSPSRSRWWMTAAQGTAVHPGGFSQARGTPAPRTPCCARWSWPR